MQKTIRSGYAELERKTESRLSEVQIKENQQNNLQSRKRQVWGPSFRRFREQQRPQQFRLLFLLLIKLFFLRALGRSIGKDSQDSSIKTGSPQAAGRFLFPV
jgi:hypothetical protein